MSLPGNAEPQIRNAASMRTQTRPRTLPRGIGKVSGLARPPAEGESVRRTSYLLSYPKGSVPIIDIVTQENNNLFAANEQPEIDEDSAARRTIVLLERKCPQSARERIVGGA